MKFVFLPWLMLFGLIARAQSTDCQCNFTISQSGYYDFKKIATPIGPGSRVCIKGGNYAYLTLVNMAGAPGQPITVTNCGGVVNVSSTSGYGGLIFRNSYNVRLTGSGDSGYPYGFNVQKTASGKSAVCVEEKSSDFEIDHVEISGSGFAGIVVKTDPSCDPSTWRGNLLIGNIGIHDNYVHDTYAEGLYVGNSFWNEGMVRTCDGVKKTVFPHNIYNLRIYNNRVERTGAEGIQYACAPNAEVFNNTVIDAGWLPFASYQSNGIQVGGGAGGLLYGNTVKNSHDVGILLVGHLGNNVLYNNIVDKTGSFGIAVINKPNTDFYTSVNIINNTVLNTGNHSIKLWNDKNFLTWVANNALLNATSQKWGANEALGKYVDVDANIKPSQINIAGNWTAPTVGAARLTDPTGGNYAPLSGSPVINVGMNADGWGIRKDMLGNERKIGNSVDAGAIEYGAPGGRLAAFSEEMSSAANPVTVYPSPCTDHLTIRLTDDRTIRHITIYDPSGTPVQTQATEPSPVVTLNVGQLQPGLYLYRVTDQAGREVAGKFAKQ